ncbi:hypothetical protein B0H17DRAFT_1101616 [Mycena rosella]|uniref:Uncharacterized protein n=1 Tax=Mycena rosella TaxID=1033263 RepID=A0AAD7CLP6_MYCRO|nr:hypothetical protein B0H17DRAFT_1101616 [Mycena rosella]
MPHAASRDMRPLPKRRRLNPIAPASAAPPLPAISLIHPTPPPISKPAPKSTSCAACHRAPGLTALLVCARCAATTCAVCSRTCTACVPSRPPTPCLTWSGPPTPAPSPAHSPRRLALALIGANTNTNSVPAPAPKRKKPRDEEDARREDEDRDRDEGAENAGCGRTVCRECCFEMPQESTTTCYDCYGR